MRKFYPISSSSAAPGKRCLRTWLRSGSAPFVIAEGYSLSFLFRARDLSVINKIRVGTERGMIRRYTSRREKLEAYLLRKYLRWANWERRYIDLSKRDRRFSREERSRGGSEAPDVVARTNYLARPEYLACEIYTRREIRRCAPRPCMPASERYVRWQYARTCLLQDGVEENEAESFDTAPARVTAEPGSEIAGIFRGGARYPAVHADPTPSPGDRVAPLAEKGKWDANNSLIIPPRLRRRAVIPFKFAHYNSHVRKNDVVSSRRNDVAR